MLGTIRLSTGKDTTKEDIDAAAAEIIRCVKKLSPKTDLTSAVDSDGIRFLLALFYFYIYSHICPQIQLAVPFA